MKLDDWSSPLWEREKPKKFWDPGRKLLLSIRKYQETKNSRGPLAFFTKKICVFRHRFWSVVCSSEIDLNTEIGGGLLLPHPYGIVIHPKAKIGINCLIFQNVTLAGEVVMETHVDIGAGAFIKGPITLHEHTTVGANAVVTKEFPANSVIAGNPAKFLKKNIQGQSR